MQLYYYVNREFRVFFIPICMELNTQTKGKMEMSTILF